MSILNIILEFISLLLCCITHFWFVVTVKMYVHAQYPSFVFMTTRTTACEAPLSIEFSRQQCWTGLPFPTPGTLSNSGIKPASPVLAGRFFTTEQPGKHKTCVFVCKIIYIYVYIQVCVCVCVLHMIALVDYLFDSDAF